MSLIRLLSLLVLSLITDLVFLVLIYNILLKANRDKNIALNTFLFPFTYCYGWPT
jgi:hypothetical protein